MIQIIHNADEKAKLWPEGKPLHTTYRLFDYLITKNVDGGLLMLNTVTGELIFLDDPEQKNLSQLPCDYAPWMDVLVQKHFLVMADSDDRKTVDLLRRSLKMLANEKNITRYTVFPTTECNARCFYCYECGISHETMSDETANKLVQYLDVHRSGEPVDIAWFGGEPLVGAGQIDRICKSLRERGIPFCSSMTSNGYLFNESLVKRAKDDWNLEQIQITLDGTEEIYNKTKAYLHPCESPYRRVLDNIQLLLNNGIEVEIRLNLGLHNADDLTALVDEIASFFEDKTNLIVYPNILFDGCGVEPIHYTDDELAVLLQRQKELNAQLIRYSPVPYRPPLPCISAIHCSMDTASVVVFPNGKLGKCQHFSDKHFVGDLEQGVTDLQEIQRLRERVVFSDCGSCPRYPVCNKLKYCEIDHSCHPLYRQYEMEGTLHAMDLYYEDFRSGVDTCIIHD